MPSKEIFRLKIGTHEITLSCCGGPGKCESGGGVLNVKDMGRYDTGSKEEFVSAEVSTCLPYLPALAFRNAMNEMLVEMAKAGTAEERSAKLRSELTALNLAVNKIREELRLV